jgi:hypothetical protein
MFVVSKIQFINMFVVSKIQVIKLNVLINLMTITKISKHDDHYQMKHKHPVLGH